MDGAAFFRGSNTHASLSDDPIQMTNPTPVTINAAQKAIVVKAAIDRVYEQWSRIEDMPRFITLLRNVRKIDEAHFSYTWCPNGEDRQGIFHIVLQIPGRRIAWRTISNGFMSGVVSFEPHSDQETEVTLKLRSIFDPPGLSRRVEEYLHNFKRLVENEDAAG
jgi:uncharacterized membrane protein